MKIKAIDLFCGAGGLTHGLKAAGIEVIAGYDIEESCRYAYEFNNKSIFFNRDITSLDGSELTKLYSDSDIKILAGCAPCQPFSTYSRTKNNQKDAKWSLLYSFSRLINQCQPDIVTMENVPGLINQKVFLDFINELKKQNYFIDYKIIYCPDYGMPQTRKRLVLLASKIKPIFLLDATHNKSNYLTVRDAIGKLPMIEAGDRDPNDALHRSSTLSPLNMERIKASKPGGDWKDWPINLRANCHLKETGKYFRSVYGRMLWNEPSPTITTQCYGFGNGRFGHPDQNRAISLREAALLQTFPKNYRFHKKNENLDIASLAKMIGNAVPVKLGEVVGKSIIAHIKKSL
ncbi:DNA (cytosine-5-)-methyltransferase [Pectobacterium odoriferum]|uniref:DNA cytosine methyltransferase n=1 Tax=Pectobacterium odoriferum TaxID=78398 RepID=UPI000D4D3348|nr:DNA cytosine methyltransferase [Pectobacterium odoriferum]POE21688.1 DNA (cytosine-5-)-methyltransferase [Pectobacterium odoriferum]